MSAPGDEEAPTVETGKSRLSSSRISGWASTGWASAVFPSVTGVEAPRSGVTEPFAPPGSARASGPFGVVDETIFGCLGIATST